MNRAIAIEILTIAIAALVGVLAATLDVLNPILRLVLALPLLVFIPGYALVRATAPGAPLSTLTRVVLGLGTGLSTAVLAGLALNLSPVGMNNQSWAALLFLITMAALIVLAIRGRDLPDVYRSPADLARVVVRGLSEGRSHVFLFSTSIVIVVAAFVIAINAYYDQPRPGFTQLWILQGSSPTAVALGVRNDEGRSIEGSVTVTRNGKVEATWPAIALADGETWQGEADIPDFQSGDVPLEATLSLSDAPNSVYREVTLWPSPSSPPSP